MSGSRTRRSAADLRYTQGDLAEIIRTTLTGRRSPKSPATYSETVRRSPGGRIDGPCGRFAPRACTGAVGRCPWDRPRQSVDEPISGLFSNGHGGSPARWPLRRFCTPSRHHFGGGPRLPEVDAAGRCSRRLGRERVARPVGGSSLAQLTAVLIVLCASVFAATAAPPALGSFAAQTAASHPVGVAAGPTRAPVAGQPVIMARRAGKKGSDPAIVNPPPSSPSAAGGTEPAATATTPEATPTTPEDTPTTPEATPTTPEATPTTPATPAASPEPTASGAGAQAIADVGSTLPGAVSPDGRERIGPAVDRPGTTVDRAPIATDPAPTVGAPATTPCRAPATPPANTTSHTPVTLPPDAACPAPAGRPATTPSPAPAGRPATTPSPAPAAPPTTTPSPAPAAPPTTTPSPAPAAAPTTTPSPAPAAPPTTTPSPAPAAPPTTTPSPAPAAPPTTTPSPAPAAPPTTTPSPAPAAPPAPTTTPSPRIAAQHSNPVPTTTAAPSTAPAPAPAPTPPAPPPTVPARTPTATTPATPVTPPPPSPAPSANTAAIVDPTQTAAAPGAAATVTPPSAFGAATAAVPEPHAIDSSVPAIGSTAGTPARSSAPGSSASPIAASVATALTAFPQFDPRGTLALTAGLPQPLSRALATFTRRASERRSAKPTAPAQGGGMGPDAPLVAARPCDRSRQRRRLRRDRVGVLVRHLRRRPGVELPPASPPSRPTGPAGTRRRRLPPATAWLTALRRL